MMFCVFWGVVSWQLLGAAEPLDSFTYRDSAAARQAWIAN
jgi:hypothetical protein